MSETSAVEVEITEAGGCRRRLNVKVPAEDVAREFEEAVRRVAKVARVSGFRKGKTPPAIVRKRFAREIEEDVRDHLLRRGLEEALERHKVHPLHDPVVEADRVTQGESYAYTAIFEVRPEIRLGEYKGLAVSMPEPEISEEDVSEALESLRQRMARFVPVEGRPAAKGDFVLADIQGHFEDAKDKDFNHEGVVVEVGAEGNLPAFNEALPAMTVGESKSFTVVYPHDFEGKHLAGRTVQTTLRVREIKVKELPALDDELPKDLGKTGTLEDLRGEIRRDLLAAARRSAERQARESLLRQLIESHPTELPEVMIAEQINLQMEEIVRGMILQGIHPGKADVDWKDLRDKQQPLAAKRVLGRLILEAIASREGVEVSDEEVRQRIAEETRGAGARTDEIRKRLEGPGSRQALKNQIVREKTLDFLLKNATITSGGGGF